jgi:membrane protein implicated in regulation of membrane protease activity
MLVRRSDGNLAYAVNSGASRSRAKETRGKHEGERALHGSWRTVQDGLPPRTTTTLAVLLTIFAILLAFLVLPQPWGVVAVVGAATIDVAQTFAYVRWSQRRRAAVGAEALVGRQAVAVTALEPRGQVRLDGELWAAVSDEAVAGGENVVVRRVEGLTLVVEKAP